MLVKKGSLHHGLQRLARVAADDATNNDGCVELKAADGQLALTLSNLNTWLRVTMPCEGDFSACIPVEGVLHFVKPADRADRFAPVEFMCVEEQQVVVAVEGAMITLPGRVRREATAWPEAPTKKADVDTITWSGRDARNLLGWVAKATTNDPTRAQLGGVFFDGGKVVATDGHRLHLVDLEGFAVPTLLPAPTIAVLLRCMAVSGTVEAKHCGDYVRFTGKGWELAVRPMEEQFPSYRSVVPQTSELASVFEVGRAAMRKLFSRLPRRTESARINVNGCLEVFADSKNDNVPAAVANAALLGHTGPDIEVCADPRYIGDALGAGGDVVIGRFGEGMSMLTLEPGPGMLALVMLQRN